MAEHSSPTRALILVAAGSGTRLAAGMPKAFVALGGRTMLAQIISTAVTVSARDNAPWQLIIVAPADRLGESSTLAQDAGADAELLTVVAGGSERQDSVAAGLAALLPSVDTVLVHDAARPLTPAAQFESVAAAVRERGHGVVPVLAVADTLKLRGAASANGTSFETLGQTLDRSQIVAVQTPQGFPATQLQQAYAVADQQHTDDAALYAAAGHIVSTIAGDARAHKITTPADLRRLEQEMQPVTPATPATPGASVPDYRIGSGLDVHAYDPQAPLWLGGLSWPNEPGLSGHSDGDALSHAICDALLAAAQLGDLGSVFGTADPRYSGAHGQVFLEHTRAMVQDAGWEIVNVTAQVIAKHPKIGPRRAELERFLGEILQAPVSVSATTTDGLGFTGRGEGVAVQATAMLRQHAHPGTPAIG